MGWGEAEGRLRLRWAVRQKLTTRKALVVATWNWKGLSKAAKVSVVDKRVRSTTADLRHAVPLLSHS